MEIVKAAVSVIVPVCFAVSNPLHPLYVTT